MAGFSFDSVMKNRFMSPYLFMVFFIATFGIFWLSAKDIDAGKLYFQLFVYSFLFLLVGYFFVHLKSEGIKLSLGFHKDNLSASVFLFLGVIVYIIIKLIVGLPFFTFTEMALQPLSSFDSSLTGQTFSQIVTSSNPGWMVFVIAFTAGVLEEIGLGVLLYNCGLIIGDLLKDIFKFAFDDWGDIIWNHSWANLVSIGIFIMLHTFNSSYTALSHYLLAGGFRLLMNICIHTLAFGIMFTIGFHFANNLSVIVQQSGQGFGYLVQAASSVPGLAVLLTFVVGVIILVVNLPNLQEVFEDWHDEFDGG